MEKELSARLCESEIEYVMSQIERCIQILELEGWAYYDPFVRFLYTIGPQTRASIRTLRFTGSSKIHEQEAAGCSCHGVDLLLNMRTYIPFINKFCINIRKLVLDMDMDFCRAMGNLEEVVRSFDEVLKPFLGDLGKLQKVRNLKRRRTAPNHVDKLDRRILYEDIEYAEDTIISIRSTVENKICVDEDEG